MKKDFGNLFLIIVVLIMILSLNSFAVTEQPSEYESHPSGGDLKESIWDIIFPKYIPGYESFSRPGDNDSDGFLTVFDARKCLKLVRKYEKQGGSFPPSTYYDCNSDGSVDEDDVSEILKTACRIQKPGTIIIKGRKGDTFYIDALTAPVKSGCAWTASCSKDKAEITVESKGVPENNPYSYESFIIKFVPNRRGKYIVNYECKNSETGAVIQEFTVVYKIKPSILY